MRRISPGNMIFSKEIDDPDDWCYARYHNPNNRNLSLEVFLLSAGDILSEISGQETPAVKEAKLMARQNKTQEAWELKFQQVGGKVMRETSPKAEAKEEITDVSDERVAGAGYKFLKPGMFAVQLVMRCNLSDRYKNNGEIAPCMLMGNPAYGKPSKKNAFERLIIEQSRFRDLGITPEWFIITRDDVSILDVDLEQRLRALKPHTHAVGANGITTIRKSGKFYAPDQIEQIKGASISAERDSLAWKYQIAPDYSEKDGWRVAAITSGMIAIRGETFLDIDFTEMAEKMVFGFYHFTADISMEVNRRGKVVGVIKTLIRQEDSVSFHVTENAFLEDQSVFVNKWKDFFPIEY